MQQFTGLVRVFFCHVSTEEARGSVELLLAEKLTIYQNEVTVKLLCIEVLLVVVCAIVLNS